MDYEVVAATAEHVIGAVDACSQFPEGADSDFVAKFLDVPQPQADNALIMARQLLLSSLVDGKNIPLSPFASYLITSSIKQRSAIFRMVLEQYNPFLTFRDRLKIGGLVHTAAEQTKVIYGFTTHRDEILHTLTNFGQYSGSLSYEGAGLYNVVETFLPIDDVSQAVEAQANARTWVASSLGIEGCRFIDPDDVFNELAMAKSLTGVDSRGLIVHAANAVESLLVQIANSHGVSLSSANGINAKANALQQAGHLNVKLHNISKYLGHIRNAADHGTDRDIDQMWDISTECASDYLSVSLTFIRAVVNFEHRIYKI